MKKLLFFVICLLMVCNYAFAEQADTFISLEDFNIYYNFAASMTGSGNVIGLDNIEAKPGDLSAGMVNDVIGVTLVENSLRMSIFMPHLENYEGVLPDINRIVLLYVPDGTSKSITKFLCAVVEIGVALGTIDITDDPDEFLETVGILDTEPATHTAFFGDLSYYYSLTEQTGCMLIVEKSSP